MDAERRIYINEDHPLNASGATKIYLNAGKSRKVDSPNDGTVIHLNTGDFCCRILFKIHIITRNMLVIYLTCHYFVLDKQADLGVHLNTTFSIASSKKIKLLFLLNFLLSLVCMVICFCVACYYWHELSSLRRQIDTMKDHLLIQNLNQEKLTVQSPLVRHPRPQEAEPREPRTFIAQSEYSGSDNAKKFFVEDLGDDLLFVDSKKKNETDAKHTTTYLTSVPKGTFP